MRLPALLARLQELRGSLLLCRGCLGPAGVGAEAGLCAACWAGLLALLQRVATAPLPPWVTEVALVTWAPGTFLPRLLRGFDLGAEAAQVPSAWGSPVRPS